MAPSLARTMPGTLELLPLEQVGFQRMLDTIRRNYERFGFLPIETPAIEFSNVLLTKTGGETERQVYFVQSTGALEKHDGQPELALRFDLTVPLARYVAQHERELGFPFRRYQLQRVYRGERAQRGRFREFYQCDIDVIGKDSLSIRYDAEIPAVIHAVFSELAIGPFTIQMNHRKLMRGFFEGLGIVDGERQTLVLREVDKLDKRGADYVRETLTGEAFGLSGEAADQILDFVQVRSTSLADALEKLDAFGAGSETFEQGRAELKEVLQLIHAFGVPDSAFALNLSIARGLDYYTGMVYETTLDEHPQIGSICSGGRYDNLASQYTKSKLPGVGISIGATRLYWQLREAGLLEDAGTSTTQALVTQMDADQLPAYLALAGELRAAGIATEVSLDGGKLGKQFKHADRSGIRFVLVLGEDELANGMVTVKDMRRNEQFEVKRDELARTLRVEPVVLDGDHLTRAQVAKVARGANVMLDAAKLQRVQRTADFLADKVDCGEPVYGITTGFGSNADKLLGAHRVRDELPGGDTGKSQSTLMEELQHNLIITHAVCVGEPFSAEVVRAMMIIRINTLMRGHSGIRADTLKALADLLNKGVVPVIPQKGSVGASGDLAPLSHLAIVLLGGGEAFYEGERMPGAEALKRAGLKAVRLSFKEGLALNNGTTQMLAMAVLALERLRGLLATADVAAAMSLDAFAGRSGALREEVHALRPHPGQVDTAAHVRDLLHDSTLLDIPYHLVPHFKPWTAAAWRTPEAQAQRFDIAWNWVPVKQRQGREAFYHRFLPFKGGKKHQPQDAYCLRCMPQVHGAVRDAIDQACRVIDIELNAVTDNPLVFPDAQNPRFIEDQVISAGHFHGMPLALAMSYVKAAIPVLASISERRLNKLVDPANSDGLPAFLTGNEDATDSGFMIVQYTAAALVNDLATRAHPASVYSIPTSANAEDHVSMGANEARHVLDMTADLGHVLGLELYTAAQALEYRQDMLNAARDLARAGDLDALAAKIDGAPREDQLDYATFRDEVGQLMKALADADTFRPGEGVSKAFAVIREHIDFMRQDRAMDRDVQVACKLVADGVFAPF